MDEGKQCVATSKRTGVRCARARVPGATVCSMHGGAAPQVQDAAARRVQEQRALALVGRIAPDADLAGLGDPFDALQNVVAISHHFALRLTAIVDRMPDSDLAYRGRLGEQLRGEVSAAQKALADLGRVAAESIKLGLDARRQRLTDNQVDLIVHALTMALEASGASLEGQERARHVLIRELTKAAG
jgi:hypothetical protein